MNKQTGTIGEQHAVELLRQKGYAILCTNYHAGRWGEIDIIARQGKTFVFVEVKTRRGDRTSLPEEAVTPAKLRKLEKAILYYQMSNRLTGEACRLDVIGLVFDSQGKIIYKNHLENVIL
ncbi:MAG TPA: YraN family protein [bacterium]|nr:YraN family protein [bacterium]